MKRIFNIYPAKECLEKRIDWKGKNELTIKEDNLHDDHETIYLYDTVLDTGGRG